MDIYTHQSENRYKTWALMVAFLLVIIALGWSASWYFQSSAILYAAVIFAVLMNFASYWWSDKIVLKMSGAEEVSRESNRELWNIVENLSITAGLPMPKLYIINDPAPNAFATGRDKEHAAVAVTRGLMERLNRSEMEGVIAHELAHVGNRDILVMTIVVTLVGFVTILSDFFLRMSFFGGGRGGDDSRSQLIMTVIGIVLAIVAPLVAMVIKLAISRKREFLADASGAYLTRYPEGLASALEKISSYSQPVEKATHATAHMYISNPFGGSGQVKGFLNRMFLTHPPAEERIARLRGQSK